jgi:hypothetical protein
LEGYWDVNRNGDWYYVVTSYNWYPIFLFINNKWYRVSNSYSSSTGKQMSQANPVRWDSGLDAKVMMVTKQEIKDIRDGRDMGEIKTSRLENFINTISHNLIGTTKMTSIGSYDDRKKVKYTITDIKQEGDKIVFHIRIDKAGKLVNGKMEINPDGYIHPSPFSKSIEDGIKERIIRDDIDYLSEDNTEFIFTHK